MGMSMFNAWSKEKKVPTFGYDANSDAVAAIPEGYGGTISQHADVQAYLTLRVLRNLLDGVDVDRASARRMRRAMSSPQQTTSMCRKTDPTTH